MPGQLRKRTMYEQLKTKLWTERSSFIAHWQDIADHTKPRRFRLNVTDRNRGDKRNQNILDETATFTLDTLASGLHAGMSSPARPWFKLAVPDPSLNETEPVKGYLHDVELRMNAVFALSNLYNALPSVYGDVSTFGTAAVACLEDAEDLLRFYTYPLGSYAVGLNSRREVCTFVLEDQLTVRQVVEQFAIRDRAGAITNRENFSPFVLTAWEKQRYEDTVDVCWVVMPNDYANADKLDAKYLPYTSCWFEVGSTTNTLSGHEGVLKEGGFRSFPVMAPRWETTANDSYGTNCPGMTMLGAVKQLQQMERKSNQWLAKLVDPPVTGPTSLKNQPTSLVAGHITYNDPRDQASALRPIHELRAEGFQYFEAKAQQIRERIKTAGFEQMFLMFQSTPYGQPMTATEVNERHQEKLLILGPALERMNEELLERCIDRAFDIMAAAGLLPEAPEELQGVTLKVEFTSVLAEAQKLTRLGGVDALINRVMPLAEAFPALLDKIDPYALVDEVARAVGASPKLVRSNEEAMAIAARRQQQQAQQAQVEQAAQLAGAAKDLSQTPTSGQTALSQLSEAAGEAA